MELFKPSISWGHALAESLSWIAIAWAISAVCLLVVLGLLRLATPWGRQFWRITDGYFTGRDSARVWLMLGVLLLSVVIGVRLSVLFSYQANDLNSSIQTAVQGMAIHDDAVKESGVHGFWMSIFHFSIMAALYHRPLECSIYTWCNGSSWRGGFGSPIDSPVTGWKGARITAPDSSTAPSTTPTSVFNRISTS